MSFIKDAKKCYLMIDLGLGKTAIALTAISDLIDSFEISKAVVVAPLRVAQKTWSDEVQHWSHLKHLRVSKMLGSQKERLAGMRADADVYTINGENVQWMCEVAGKRFDGEAIFLDESTLFKNRTSRRFKYLKKWIGRFRYVVLMSATPAPNGYGNLWSQFYLIDQGERLGPSFGGYIDRFFKTLDYAGYKLALKKGADEAIHARIKDVTMTLRAEDYLKMPPCTYRDVPVPLSDEAAEKYKAFEKNCAMQMQEGEVVAAESAASLSTKLTQLASGAVYDEERKWHLFHDAKLDALEELIEEAQGEPMLVAYAYRSDLERLKARFPHAQHLGKDVSVIDRWNRGEVPLLLAHPQSAGHGLNLQHGGRQVVWFTQIFDLELYLQMNGRLNRQGQRKPVVIHHLVAQQTIDETIVGALRRKDASQQGLLSALKQHLISAR